MCRRCDSPSVGNAVRIPQWVIDRQQYETTFVYVPPATETVSRIPQWVIDRQQYETSYIYVPPAVALSPADNRCPDFVFGE